MVIVVDSSVLIYHYFGNSGIKNKIKKIFDSDQSLAITKIVKFEFRNIFLDFFRLKQIMYENLELIKKGDLYYNQFSSQVLEDFSKKYFMRTHTLGRIRILFQNILNDYSKSIIDKSFQFISDYEKEEDDSIETYVIGRIETIVYNLEHKLLQIYSDLNTFDLIEDFNCFISDWKFFYDNLTDSFKIDINKTCSQVVCNFDQKICSFYSKNEHFIKNTIKFYFSICQTRKIKNPDKNLIETLKKIQDFCKYDKNQKLSIKLCRYLGDFFIASILDKNLKIYTKNARHFLPLLDVAKLDNMIILN